MSGTAPPDCQRKVNSTANNKLQKVWAGSGALQRVLIYAHARTSTPSGLQILVHGYIRLSLIAIYSLACLLNRSDDLQRVTSGYVPL